MNLMVFSYSLIYFDNKLGPLLWKTTAVAQVLVTKQSLWLQALLARERAKAEFEDWEKKEEEVCSWYLNICY